MTENPSGPDSTTDNQAGWNRQASTFDWEGWIAEENEADARRAEAAGQATSAAHTDGPPSFAAPTGPPAGYPPPSGPAAGYAPPSAYNPPPSFAPATTAPYPAQPGFAAPTSSHGYRSPDGHPMPVGYAQPGMPGFRAAVPTKRPLDKVCLYALIFGIIPAPLIGLILGIIGITRTSSPFRRGRWMAVTGLVLALAWTSLAVGLATIWKPAGSTPAAITATRSAPVTKPTTATPATLRPGDCYKDTALAKNSSGSSQVISSIKIIPCAQAHNAVVYAATTLPAGAWTSMDDKLTIANKQCLPLAKKYFNGHVLNPNLLFGALAPSETRWDLGFHTAQCVAVDPDKDFKGDIRQDR